jgi:hypothetical protein
VENAVAVARLLLRATWEGTRAIDAQTGKASSEG